MGRSEQERIEYVRKKIFRRGLTGHRGISGYDTMHSKTSKRIDLMSELRSVVDTGEFYKLYDEIVETHPDNQFILRVKESFNQSKEAYFNNIEEEENRIAKATDLNRVKSSGTNSIEGIVRNIGKIQGLTPPYYEGDLSTVIENGKQHLRINCSEISLCVKTDTHSGDAIRVGDNVGMIYFKNPLADQTYLGSQISRED